MLAHGKYLALSFGLHCHTLLPDTFQGIFIDNAGRHKISGSQMSCFVQNLINAKHYSSQSTLSGGVKAPSREFGERKGE